MSNEWESLMRGQIVSVTTQKFFSYVNLADQKAQGLILLNSILVPVTLKWAMGDEFATPATISLVTCLLSILAAIICIYPRRRAGRKPDGTFNLLHFGDIGRMKEEEYLAEFQPIFNDPNQLAEASVKDLHDTARRIILPKFMWLKISYSTFFIGNVIAVITLFMNF